MRPTLHYEPRRGWMNDPNGLIHWGGRHHMFYQYNPDSTEGTNQHWGHASSVDLVRWTEHQVAVAPGGVEGTYDSTAIYSGCAFEVDGTVAILYTGVEGDKQLPCLAFAADEDLTSFVKDSANPVIDKLPGDVVEMRDHSVWRDGSLWRQVSSGASESNGAAAFGFRSADLRNWSYDGVLIDAATADIPGSIWECPDIFHLDGYDVLMVSTIRSADDPGPEVWWISGELIETRLALFASGPADLGDRLYAPQSYWANDGRRLMFGWLRTHADPAAHGRDSLGAMSLPRELSVVEGRLRSEPARELESLRHRRTDFELGTDDRTRLVAQDAMIGELVLDAASASRVTNVVLVGDGGKLMIDVTVFGPSPGGLRLFWDGGIVEAFRDGQAAAWSDLSLGRVACIHLYHGPGSASLATIWDLSVEPT